VSIIKDVESAMTRQRSEALIQGIGIAVAWIVALAMTTLAR
jgi:hypothetical protein